ncbi:hypothetical protein QAD02_012462 [Eretmocerus hayati]|uniref:Uncharacterized protein n=1 Tax=Eretmocerus hayati TaxID=131215 RepID=A0ACC2NZF8_9HYME|nr:hypothetical protein QAD02_012462 [Eretmocerus hayati]
MLLAKARAPKIFSPARLTDSGLPIFCLQDESRASSKSGDKKRWIHDPNNELCRPLNCKKSEICLLEDAFTAVCISKKELHKTRAVVVSKSRNTQQRKKIRADTQFSAEDDDAFFDSEDDDEDQDDSNRCQECPVASPSFLCGSDNRTYSSPCRLEHHNCIHHTSVHANCTGFCPCKRSDSKSHPKKSQLQRQRSLLGKNKNNRDITLTPRDFNYDNHHYQYLKYSKRAKTANDLKYDDKYLMSNEVMEKTLSPLKPVQPRSSAECPSSSRPAMANRLLDWFSVVMSDSKHRRQHPKPRGHFPIGCQSEVRWMFGHLDVDSDGKISLTELYGLEHDQNEPCLKPFLDSCDIDGDIFVSGPEWCGCFSKAERPCAAVRRRSSPEVAPSCDSRGYYESVQCHRALNICWCVDQHGIEFAGTRVRGSKPDCDSIVNKISNGGIKTNSVDLEDDEDSVQDLEGSADFPLDF